MFHHGTQCRDAFNSKAYSQNFIVLPVNDKVSYVADMEEAESF